MTYEINIFSIQEEVLILCDYKVGLQNVNRCVVTYSGTVQSDLRWKVWQICYVKKIRIIKSVGRVGSELSEVNNEKNITEKSRMTVELMSNRMGKFCSKSKRSCPFCSYVGLILPPFLLSSLFRTPGTVLLETQSLTSYFMLSGDKNVTHRVELHLIDFCWSLATCLWPQQ